MNVHLQTSTDKIKFNINSNKRNERKCERENEQKNSAECTREGGSFLCGNSIFQFTSLDPRSFPPLKYVRTHTYCVVEKGIFAWKLTLVWKLKLRSEKCTHANINKSQTHTQNANINLRFSQNHSQSGIGATM